MAVTVIIQCDAWKDAWKTARADIREAIRATLKQQRRKAGSVAVVLMDDAGMLPLNRTYRGKPKPTNVLSFSEEEGGGDIVLAYETICREAMEQGKTFRAHAMHLVVHGMLHLLGHDHEDEAEAETMESQEIIILKTLAIANPYRVR